MNLEAIFSNFKEFFIKYENLHKICQIKEAKTKNIDNSNAYR